MPVTAPAAIDAARSLLTGAEPQVAGLLRRAREERVARRIWEKDESLWGGRPGTPELTDRLGWLTIAERMEGEVGRLAEFAAGCVAEGLRDAVLLGMGGSSLAPEVLRLSFRADRAGGASGSALRLHVLDSTDPDAILAVQRQIDLERTLFLVSTKSGGTLETFSLFRYFQSLVRERLGEPAGTRFAAVTDPGSALEQVAREDGFRATFLADPEIGGRYSALSLFGLVPATLAGIDVAPLLAGARAAAAACRAVDPAENPGLWLGAVLGGLARSGRDKLTFVVAPRIASFGLWAEQLVAESTGKHQRGLLPVAGEPLGEPDVYGGDRVFLHLSDAQEPDGEDDRRCRAIAERGDPMITLPTRGPADLGRIFFLSEFATAVAGWALEINPFDQPNVQEAKDRTKEVLAEHERRGVLPELDDASEDELRELLASAVAAPAVGEATEATPAGEATEAVPASGATKAAPAGEATKAVPTAEATPAGSSTPYVAIMGYVAPSPAFDAAVAELRLLIRARTKAATTFGYGPRFLHSTGQFHKGGPRVGCFLQLLARHTEDLPVPGAPYGFATLESAQAIGDAQALRGLGLPLARVHLDGSDPAGGVRALTARLRDLA